MERLWAPWRMSYIDGLTSEGDGSGECFLCAAWRARGEEEAQRLVLARSERAFVVMNKFPYNNGHLLVAPERHAGTLDAFGEADLAELMGLVRLSARALAAEMRPDGFNVGLNIGRAAGAGLAGHLHWHVVPRWNGDTNAMPVVGGVKVIPQSLEELHARLAPRFAEAERGGGAGC